MSSDGSDLRQRYAEALAAKFTSPIPRCDKWGENEWVENPEPADRVGQVPIVMLTAGDGRPSFRMPTCTELAEAVAAERDEELERLRMDARVGATDRRINSELRQEITRLQINAERDVCSGCMLREEARDRAMESARQNGVKYEQAKQRWYEEQERAEKAEAANARTRERLDALIAAGFGAVGDTLRELRAALDGQEPDRG